MRPVTTNTLRPAGVAVMVQRISRPAAHHDAMFATRTPSCRHFRPKGAFPLAEQAPITDRRRFRSVFRGASAKPRSGNPSPTPTERTEVHICGFLLPPLPDFRSPTQSGRFGQNPKRLNSRYKTHKEIADHAIHGQKAEAHE
jgi:hypothetical protein